jgi:hypothetical protein
MEAFGQRFGFEFAAHEKGDANRSAHVEVGFNHVDNNFLAGRTFNDWSHINREAVAWCDRTNAAFSRKLHASRTELFATERVNLEPLPIWIPQVYTLHQRIVDIEGYVSVHTNRYTVPYQLIGRRVEVRETQDRIEVYNGPRKVAEHDKVIDARGARVCKKEHRPPRGRGRSAATPCPEEKEEGQGARRATAAQATFADARVPPRPLPRGRAQSRALRPVRPGPARAHGAAKHRTRVLCPARRKAGLRQRHGGKR